MAASKSQRGAKSSKPTEPASGAKAAAPAAEEAAPKRRRTYLPAEERRRRIIIAAQEVFARSSLHGARTRDLAKAAEVNQATLFEHFESKEALFQEAVVLPLLEAMAGMRGRARSYETAETLEELRGLANASSQRHYQAMLEIFPLFTAALFSDLETGKKLYQEQIAPLLQERSQTISRIVREPLDPYFVELAAFGILFALAMDQTFSGEKWDIEELASQMIILTTRGFAKDFSELRDPPAPAPAKRAKRAKESGKGSA